MIDLDLDIIFEEFFNLLRGLDEIATSRCFDAVLIERRFRKIS